VSGSWDLAFDAHRPDEVKRRRLLARSQQPGSVTRLPPARHRPTRRVRRERPGARVLATSGRRSCCGPDRWAGTTSSSRPAAVSVETARQPPYDL